jgi:hypothetical protein
MLLLSWLGGVLLAAVQLLPFAEFVLHSLRFGGLGFQKTTAASYHPYEFLQLIVPYVFGPLVPQIRWFGQTWLDTFYIGIFPLLLCVVFFFFSRHRLKVFLGLLVAVSVFLCLGKYNPLFPYLYRFVPGMDMLQYPVKFLYIAAFALSAGAGLGYASFEKSLEDKKISGISICLVAVFAALLAAFNCWALFYDKGYLFFLKHYHKSEYYLKIAQDTYYGLFQSAACVVVLVALFLSLLLCRYRRWVGKKMLLAVIIVCVLTDLYFLGRPDDPLVQQDIFYKTNAASELFSQERSPFRFISLMRYKTNNAFWHVYERPFEENYTFMLEGLQPNLNMYGHFQAAQEYGELKCRRYYDLFNAASQYFDRRFFNGVKSGEAECMNVLSLLNIKYVLSPFDLGDLNLELVADGRVKIYRNPAAMPRAFFVKGVEIVSNDAEALQKMKDRKYDLREVAYMTRADAEKAPFDLSGHDAPLKGPLNGSIVITHYEPNALVLEARTDQPALLVIADTYYPGWQAYDNGRPVTILRVNHTLRGIAVMDGQHSVRLEFRPGIFYAGAGISLTAALCLAAGLCLCAQKELSRCGHGAAPPNQIA